MNPWMMTFTSGIPEPRRVLRGKWEGSHTDGLFTDRMAEEGRGQDEQGHEHGPGHEPVVRMALVAPFVEYYSI